MAVMAPTRQDVMQAIDIWAHEKPRDAVRKMMDQYGVPSEVTPRRVIWHDAGPWKRVMIVDEEIPHHFPKDHVDFLYQVITHDVPADKADELLAFDESLIIDIPKKELGSRCQMEGANFLTVNLAHEIITGQRSVEEARQFMREAELQKQHPNYMQGFRF